MNDLDIGFDLVKWSNYRELNEDEHDKIISKQFYIYFLIDNPHVYHNVEES